MTTVRTRFAPSPTGYLHIGGVRTALFCWLFARQHGPDGKFVLRIDDTDAERNVDEALAPILHGLKWMGIDWDEGPEIGGPYGPYFQSQRQSLYQDAARELIERGAAYRDYARPEELQAERDAAQAAGGSFIYSRRWMAETLADCARFEAEGRTGVVRLKMPREGKLVIADLIRGDVEFDWAREQDHVIQRANGSCLYHLASVVDDHEMQITHVIRAEEHLSNTPRQIFILESLGYTRPAYAHLPYVAEPGSKTKLSKRKLDKYLKNRDFAALAEQGQRIAQAIGIGASADTFNPVIVDFYEQIGFLPEAVLNYLLLLGWSLDDTREFFTRQEMIESFSLDRVNKAPASFDPRKLLAFQDHYMRQLPPQQKVELVVPYLERAGYVTQPATAAEQDRALKVVEAAGDRIKLAGDVLDYSEFFVADDRLAYDEKAVEKRLRKDTGASELLAAFRGVLADTTPFDAATIEHALGDFMAGRGLRPGDIVHALRVAVTGKEVGIGLFDTLAILGRDSCLKRLDRALELAA